MDDPLLRANLPRMTRRVVTYGFDAQAQCRAQDWTNDTGASRFTAVGPQGVLGKIELHVPVSITC